MGTNAAQLYETRREEIAEDFFRSLHDFSNGGFLGGEYSQNGNSAPHLLRAEYNRNDRYFGTLFRMARELLEKAYESSYAHRYYCILSFPAPDEENNPASKWSGLIPEVEKIISAHGPEVKQAFLTLFEICHLYQKSEEEILPDHNGRTITREKNGITQGQASRLQDALLKIWQAYPETDTRISEGFDYIMMSDPIVRKTFTFTPPIGGVSAYNFSDLGSDRRSDYRLAEMLESYDGTALKCLGFGKHLEKAQPKEVAAIAAQTLKNLEMLQEFSVPIAERCLASFVDAVSRDSSNKDAIAKQIFDSITSMKSTVKGEAQKIRKGEYGELAGGYTNWLQKDDERKRALFVAGGAEDYLKLCVDIRRGEWFKQEREKIAMLCTKKNLPGFSSRLTATAPSP